MVVQGPSGVNVTRAPLPSCAISFPGRRPASTMRDWRDRLRSTFPALVGLVLFGAALLVLRRELHTLTWRELTRDILDVPRSRSPSSTTW
jgi:hypothetical protein